MPYCTNIFIFLASTINWFSVILSKPVKKYFSLEALYFFFYEGVLKLYFLSPQTNDCEFLKFLLLMIDQFYNF